MRRVCNSMISNPVLCLCFLHARLHPFIIVCNMESEYAAEVVPGLYVGSLRSLGLLEQLGITHVLSVVNFEPSRDLSDYTVLHVPLRDDEGANLLTHLPAAFTFIHNALTNEPAAAAGATTSRNLHGPLDEAGEVQWDAEPAPEATPADSASGAAAPQPAQVTAAAAPHTPGMSKVLVHCQAGQSRSVAVVAAYLMKSRGIDDTEALELIRASWPSADPNEGFLAQLGLFHDMRCSLDPDHPVFRLWCLDQVGRQWQEEGWVDPDSFAVLPDEQQAARSKVDMYRCRKCRRMLATARNVMQVDEVAVSQAVFGRRKGFTRKATHTPGQQAQADEGKALFLEPMEWMAQTVVGMVQGKLYCPGCNARLGSFNWSGITNEAGLWIIPAFQVHTSKVDVVQPVRSLASVANIRVPLVGPAAAATQPAASPPTADQSQGRSPAQPGASPPTADQSQGRSPAQPAASPPTADQNQDRSPAQPAASPPTADQSQGRSPAQPAASPPTADQSQGRSPAQPGASPPTADQNQDRSPAQPAASPPTADQSQGRSPAQPAASPPTADQNQDRSPAQPGASPPTADQNQDRSPAQPGASPPTADQNQDRSPAQPGASQAAVSTHQQQEQQAAAAGGEGVCRTAWFTTLVLDCDGVLVDSERASCEALRQGILKVTGFDIPHDFPRDYYEVFGMDVKGCVAHYKTKFNRHEWHDVDELAVEVQAAKEIAYQELTQQMGLPAFPGAAPLIAAARSLGMSVGIGSSGAPSKIHHNLSSSGLAGLVADEHIVSASHVAQGKPAPDVYIEVIRRLSCDSDPSRALVVEDTVNGLKAARGAGACSVAVTTSLPRPTLQPWADLVLDRLEELVPLLATLTRDSIRSSTPA